MLLACTVLILLSGFAFAIDVPSCTTVLASSGYYALTNSLNASNITDPTGSLAVGCLNITGVNILLDLGGWKIENSSLNIGYGIVVFANASNITIMNGSIQNFTGATGGGIYFAGTNNGVGYNSSVHNITFTNMTTGINLVSGSGNVTINNVTVRNTSRGIHVQAGNTNTTITNSNITNSTNALFVESNGISGFTINLTVRNTELSYSRVGFNNTAENPPAEPGAFNLSLIGVTFLNNSLYDFYGNDTNNTFFTNVMFNTTNISANFTDRLIFTSSKASSATAPLAYNLSTFVNISKAGITYPPGLRLVFHYLDSSLTGEESSLQIYEDTGSWAVVSSSVETGSNVVTAPSITSSLRVLYNQYGLFLSASGAISSSSDEDTSRRSLQRLLDPIPFDYSCKAGQLVINTIPNARVHVSQVCDPACGMATGGLSCSFDVDEKRANADGDATFGGNGYYYVNILQTTNPEYRSEANHDFCFASCGGPTHSFAISQEWSCSPKGLSVTVRDENGALVNGATVELVTDPVCPAGAQCLAQRAPGITKESVNGIALFTYVPEGSDRLYISKDGFDTDSFALSASSCGYNYQLADDCTAKPYPKLAVTITDGQGNPVSGAEVYIGTTDTFPNQANPNAQAYGVTDATGKALVMDIDSAGANILVRKNGVTTIVGHQAFVPVENRCAKELMYVLELVCPDNKVRVTVTDKATGEPVEGANVVYSVVPGVSDSKGQVEFTPEENEMNRYLYISKDEYPTAISVSISDEEQGVCTARPDDGDDGTDNGNDGTGTDDGTGNGGSIASDKCVDLQISVDKSKGLVGENVKAFVKCGSVPLANKEVIIVPPQGPSRKATTDASGAISLPLEFQGTYQVGVARGNEIVDRENIQVGLNVNDTPDNKGVFAFFTSDPVRASLLVLILAAALIGAYLYLRSTKGGKSKKFAK